MLFADGVVCCTRIQPVGPAGIVYEDVWPWPEPHPSAPGFSQANPVAQRRGQRPLAGADHGVDRRARGNVTGRGLSACLSIDDEKSSCRMQTERSELQVEACAR